MCITIATCEGDLNHYMLLIEASPVQLLRYDSISQAMRMYLSEFSFYLIAVYKQITNRHLKLKSTSKYSVKTIRINYV